MIMNLLRRERRGNSQQISSSVSVFRPTKFEGKMPVIVKMEYCGSWGYGSCMEELRSAIQSSRSYLRTTKESESCDKSPWRMCSPSSAQPTTTSAEYPGWWRTCAQSTETKWGSGRTQPTLHSQTWSVSANPVWSRSWWSWGSVTEQRISSSLPSLSCQGWVLRLLIVFSWFHVTNQEQASTPTNQNQIWSNINQWQCSIHGHGHV